MVTQRIRTAFGWIDVTYEQDLGPEDFYAIIRWLAAVVPTAPKIPSTPPEQLDEGCDVAVMQ